MPIRLDHDLETVLQFMERNLEADKLVSVAKVVAELAPVLWSGFNPLSEHRLLRFSQYNHEQQSIATESDLARRSVGDDSEAAIDRG